MNAALPSTNSLATATGIGSSATGGAGSGSSGGGLFAGTPSSWQSCTQWFVGVFVGSCVLLNLFALSYFDAFKHEIVYAA
jgi:hypothetical protein